MSFADFKEFCAEESARQAHGGRTPPTQPDSDVEQDSEEIQLEFGDHNPDMEEDEDLRLAKVARDRKHERMFQEVCDSLRESTPKGQKTVPYTKGAAKKGRKEPSRYYEPQTPDSEELDGAPDISEWFEDMGIHDLAKRISMCASYASYLRARRKKQKVE